MLVCASINACMCMWVSYLKCISLRQLKLIYISTMPLLQFLCDTHVYITDICQCYMSTKVKKSTDMIAVNIPDILSSQKEHANFYLYGTVTWHKFPCTAWFCSFCVSGDKNRHITLLVLKTHCSDNCFKVDIMTANSFTWYLEVRHMS